MKIRSLFSIISLALILFVSIPSPCYAARIYNDVGFNVMVHGNPGQSNEKVAEVPSGLGSADLTWDDVSIIRVDDKFCAEVYCYLDTNSNYLIQGDNYMKIEANRNCFICDPDDNTIAGQGNCKS